MFKLAVAEIIVYPSATALSHVNTYTKNMTCASAVKLPIGSIQSRSCKMRKIIGFCEGSETVPCRLYQTSVINSKQDRIYLYTGLSL